MQVTFRILRYNPEKDNQPHFQDYTIEANPTMTVLDVLHQIKWNIDGTLSFRRSCAHGICGSDGMKINGKNGLACSTLLKDLNTKKPVTIEPLPAMPIVKDLIVDMSDFYKKSETIKPYLINTTPAPPDSERLQSNENYLGPAALLKAYRFVFDTRDDAADERLNIIDSPDGIWRCHTIFNCVDACPKEINITWHLSQLKKKTSTREL